MLCTLCMDSINYRYSLSQAVDTAPTPIRGCSQQRSSTIELTLDRTMNGFLVRCTVQQDTSNAIGQGHTQTHNIEVKCKNEI